MKPLHIFKAALSGRYYATRSVKQLSHMHMVCTGKKEDVTEQIEALIAAAAPVATPSGAQATEGCGSHSCRVKKPTGMGVNGPCQCPKPTLGDAIKKARGGITDPVAAINAVNAAYAKARATPAPTQRSPLADFEGDVRGISEYSREELIAEIEKLQAVPTQRSAEVEGLVEKVRETVLGMLGITPRTVATATELETIIKAASLEGSVPSRPNDGLQAMLDKMFESGNQLYYNSANSIAEEWREKQKGTAGWSHQAVMARVYFELMDFVRAYQAALTPATASQGGGGQQSQGAKNLELQQQLYDLAANGIPAPHPVQATQAGGRDYNDVQYSHEARAWWESMAARLGWRLAAFSGWQSAAFRTGKEVSAQLTGYQMADIEAALATTQPAQPTALREALEAVRPWMIPGMNWTDEIGRRLIAMVDAALTTPTQQQKEKPE